MKRCNLCGQTYMRCRCTTWWARRNPNPRPIRYARREPITKSALRIADKLADRVNSLRS